MIISFPLYEDGKCPTVVMDAVNSYETSVGIYQTTRSNIPEDSYLQLFDEF
jgi:hypothetical protein